MFFTLTPDKKKAENALNRFMYLVDDVKESVANGSLQLGISGVAFFSATELDLFFYLRERGVAASNFNRFCLDDEKREELRAHGYRTVKMMDVDKMSVKFDFNTAFGKVAQNQEIVMSCKTKSELIRKSFNGGLFAANADAMTFAPPLLRFFQDWAATPRGLMIEMSTRLVDDDKTSTQTLGQHASVVSRMWPECVVMTESGKGIMLAGGSTCWSTFEAAMEHVHSSTLSSRPVYLITNCGYGSRTYSDLASRRVTHMYVAFSGSNVNNILTKYQAITRGNGWFRSGDARVKILISEADWAAVGALESLTEMMFSTYPHVPTNLSVLHAGILSDYGYAHGLNEAAKRCRSDVMQGGVTKRARISRGINEELWNHVSWQAKVRPGMDAYDPEFVNACDEALLSDVAPGAMITTKLELIRVNDNDAAQLNMIFKEGSKLPGSRCRIYPEIREKGGLARLIRTGSSSAHTYHCSNINPQHIKSQHYVSIWAYMKMFPDVAQVIVRKGTPEQAIAAQKVIFHTFVEGLKGVAVNFA
jgi:hypothetical protein